MHAILFGRKIYALDMPSNFIFTHRRWLCGTGGERISRHNHLRYAIFEAAAAAGLGLESFSSDLFRGQRALPSL